MKALLKWHKPVQCTKAVHMLGKFAEELKLNFTFLSNGRKHYSTHKGVYMLGKLLDKLLTVFFIT